MIWRLNKGLQQLVIDEIAEFVHPRRVAAYAQNDDEFVVAMFHDAIEDGVYSELDLVEAGITPEQLESILILTRDYDRETKSHKKGAKEPYRLYINNIIDSENRTALSVKVYDIYDHLRPENLYTTTNLRRAYKYTNALKALVFGVVMARAGTLETEDPHA